VEPSVTDQASGSTQTPDAPSTAISTAEALVAARERKGMGRGEVAQRLKLHPKQLEAIERGDWAALPGRAFARGCVRSYGRLLDVDVEPLLATIGAVGDAESLRPTATLAAPLPRGGGFGFDGEGQRSKLPWAVLGVIGVIAVALFFGRDGDVSKVSSWIGKPDGAGAPSGASSTPAADGAGPGAATGAAAPASPASGSAAPAAAGTPLVPPPLVPAPGAAGPAGTAATAATAAAQAAAPTPSPPAPAAPPPPPPVRITVKQDSWVDVRQADGKSVFMGTVKPGAPLELKGVAPFSLTIGNASAVTLEYEGQPIDLKPVTGSPNNIAKVRLP
jgi:cytoskeleton protein RodZ